MAFCRGELLAQQISKFSPMSICEAFAVQRRVFADGPADRAEAEVLFGVCSTFEPNDSAWKCAFTKTITDHLLGQGQQYGFLEFDGEEWLMEMLSAANGLHQTIVFELMKCVVETAQNASEELARFALSCTLQCLREPAAQFSQEKSTHPQAAQR